MSRCWIILSALMLCLISGTALAENRVAVRPFFGPHADDARKEILKILSKHRELSLVSPGDVEQSAKRLRVDANSPEGRVAIATSLQVAAWVEAIVQRQGRELRATVLVYDGRNHQRIARTVLTRRTPKEVTAALRRSFWKDSRDALLSAEAPPKADDDQAVAVSASPVEETPESEAPEAPPEEEESPEVSTAPAEPSVPAESPASSSMALGKKQTLSSARWHVSPAGASVPTDAPDAPDSLFVSISVGTLSRVLTYEDPQTQSLGDYTLAVAPQATLSVRYFPAARFTDGFLSYWGLDLDAQVALAAASETNEGEKYATWTDSYGVGGRAKFPIGAHDLSLAAGYGIRRFQFSDTEAKPSPTPDVEYRYVRLGAELDFALGERVRMGTAGAFLWLRAAGEIASADWFPHTIGNGVEATLFASFQLSSSLDLVANLSLAHFFFSFQPEVGDPKVAGGATDDFITGGLGIRLRL